MALTAKEKELLNKFSLSQPALNDETKPYPASAIKLGDLLEEAMATEVAGAENAAYTPATSGNWDGDPATLKEAIDRLAAAVYTLDTDTPIA
jgi:hypothetical protein